MLTKDQTAKLRAWVIQRAKAYVGGYATYDNTCFTTAEATVAAGASATLDTMYALERLESEGLVRWTRPSSVPGYWMPTAAATRAEVAP